MTTNDSRTKEFTIDRLVLRAFQLASLMPLEQPMEGTQWEDQSRFGREMLELIVKSLQTEGKLIRAWKFYDVDLVEGTSDYVLTEDILDVFEDAVVIDSEETETVVKQIDLAQWQRMGSRGATGRPSLYYAHRAEAPVMLRMWPTPERDYTLRIQAYYLFTDCTDGSKTLELERHWGLPLTYLLAQSLARSAGLHAQAAALGNDAAVPLKLAKGYSHQRTPNQVMVMHSGGSRRGRW